MGGQLNELVEFGIARILDGFPQPVEVGNQEVEVVKRCGWVHPPVEAAVVESPMIYPVHPFHEVHRRVDGKIERLFHAMEHELELGQPNGHARFVGSTCYTEVCCDRLGYDCVLDVCVPEPVWLRPAETLWWYGSVPGLFDVQGARHQLLYFSCPTPLPMYGPMGPLKCVPTELWLNSLRMKT